MNQSLSIMLMGGLIRVLQGFAAAAPTLLVGLLIASIMRYYLADKGMRRLFGGDSLRSLPQSWLVGMLLPVCSIGVLPILREMRRAGVKPGAMSAFALSAPLFNPLSLLYGLTLSRPMVIILFAFGSLVIVTALGLFWDAMAKFREPTKNTLLLAGGSCAIAVGKGEPETRDHLISLRRLAATFVHIARELTGVSLGTTVLALSGLAILAAVLPYGAMQHSVERDDWFAPLTMLEVAIPVYATPMLAMSQLGMMFQHANSPGAAFTLLILGTGMNLATPVWFGKHYGFKATTLWMVSLVVIVLGISYAINRPLVPPGVEPAGHTHAFDIYANPISVYHHFDMRTLRDLVVKDLDISVVVSLAVLGVIGLIGIGLRLLKIDEAWLMKTAKANAFASSLTSDEAKNRKGLDVVVPPGVIGATMLAGLVALSVVACFAYYPSPKECLDEISMARAECLSAANSGQIDHALFWLPVWEDWSRRLEVGTFIRSGQIRPYQRMQGYLIRKKLENLEHELEHDPFESDETKRVVRDILSTNSRWVRSFRPSE
ncbi:permease [Novipirellula artificiosorum]|uniref:Putative permease n=1 Tax=Novipirellula artificiosorum TaxID=2528016 RepID=A0A5C6D5Y5_9BACT|nr:permease [Novipirellula artificiosorum]TWU31117.1 putative permease [Novipirellula artificiosorum]